MRPLILTHKLAIDSSMHSYILHRLRLALDRTLSKIGAITVRLSDDNGPKGGADKTVQVKLVVPGHDSVIIHERGSDLRSVVDRAIHRAAQTVQRVSAKRHKAARKIASRKVIATEMVNAAEANTFKLI
ncbi:MULTISPECIES: HPF/RaiA family ribosome-associated protein [Deefgea]|uniref:HPF/RaiA family ribosome-associated protein n=1 Tax=Deefgea chitinilytica TaxID=570276 RepID=A0ABS2CD41_9NEIS|nr:MULTISPECIES: HPF/RaiA family ribosome-associated protein [Deefgea]MBM5572070.1 HPF/RaiA family ribosome-associated protein [Deefgea chitinilytica]MBM9889305.1 HPF/RaiA family ribosome-associated protein [Deefgea sp. CFH1-16]